MEQQIRQAIRRAFNELQNVVLRREFRGMRSRMDKTDSKLDDAIHKLDNTDRKLDNTEASIQQELQELNSRMGNTERFMREESQRMGSRMDDAEGFVGSRFDSTEIFIRQGFHKSGSQMNNLDVVLRNSKIAHIGQKVLPLPAYDITTQQPLPTPKGFPTTALGFYNLQYTKNWRKLKRILEYYHLESEVIELAHFSDDMISNPDLMSDVDSDFESKSKPMKSDFSSAVEANSSGAVIILARHLGVDYNVLHDKITEHEFRKMGQKRRLDDGIEVKDRSKRIALQPESEDERHVDRAVKFAEVTIPEKEQNSSDDKDTVFSWKNDAVKVQQHYQDMGYGSTSLKNEEIEEGTKSISENRMASDCNDPGSPSTRVIPGSEIQQNLS